MEWLAAFVLLISFLFFLVLRVPIAVGIAFSSFITLFLHNYSLEITSTTIAQRMATGLDSFALLAIPFFILSGQLMNQGGIARRLIDFAKVFVGRLPGGLAFVNILASMFFGSISGSAVAATAAIGGFMGPRMKQEGYEVSYAAAINITSSTTGLIIPPSNILIVYSLASGGVSIAALFIAGYLPGILIGLALMGMAGYIAVKKNYPRGEKVGVRQAIFLFFDALPSLFLIVIVIGGILAGIFTATEASGVAVLYSFLLSVIVYREIPIRKLPDIVRETAVTTAIVMFLVGASMAMSWILSYENIPQSLSSLFLSISDNKYVALIFINIILLFIGSFMDITPAVLIFTPIFLPVVIEMGVHPVHFGMLMVTNLVIGLCTPPVGSVLFVGSSVAGIDILALVRPILPFYFSMIVMLLVITFLPLVSLWLPRLFGLL
jgi:tripartite ATP-independent transporter DctM subunit